MFFAHALRGFIILCAVSMLMPAYAQSEPVKVDPIKITVSFSILGDMVQQIGGEAVDVRVLVGPGQNSHQFQPKPQDAALLSDAEIIAINGLGFEGWMGRLVEASGTKAKLLVASRGIVPRHLSAEEKRHEHGHDNEHAKKDVPIFDPHAWHDLKNAELYARNITSALIEARPSYKSFFKDQAVAYIKKIRELDAKLIKDFEAVPEEQRKVVTNHDAFGYFAQAYGIAFYAPIGISMSASPSASDIAALVNQIKEDNIRVVFMENMSSPRFIRQLAKDTKASIGGVLYAGALSPLRGPAPTYLDMIAHNAKLILKGISR